MPDAFEAAVAEVREGADPAKVAATLLDQLTTEERLWLLDGDHPFWDGLVGFFAIGYNTTPIVAGEIARLGIPGIRFSDGPRGAVIGNATCFPVPMARGATWDPGLEERVGEAIGAEIRAQGGNFFGGVCVNLLRHPAWGRAQETYGEDPLLLGTMGAALARGAQRHVMACVKHFALNSMENARFKVDVRVGHRALHEVYLPHFRMVVEAGVMAVMSAYNKVNGEWCGQNRVLLTGILRDEWGFQGIVVSDFLAGLRDAVASVRAGLDIEMPFRQQRAIRLPSALPGLAADVDAACLRILSTQLRGAASAVSPAPDSAIVACAEHRALALKAAIGSMVLLRNESVLPLTDPRHVVLVGPLADRPNTGDQGSSQVRPPYVVTPLEGLRHALPGARVEHVTAHDPAVARADAAIVVVGYTAADEGEYTVMDEATMALFPPLDDPADAAALVEATASGEDAMGRGGDRTRLTLRPSDEHLIRQVAAANPRTVVVVTAGSAVIMEAWRHAVPAILLQWYPGMEGGHALASVLLGESEPGGRLPLTLPRSESSLPAFDAEATSVIYNDMYGYRLVDRPAYPFGFGLSYTTFGLSGFLAELAGDRLSLSVTVANTGARSGSHVVQFYANGGLLDFARVRLEAGESVAVRRDSSLMPIAHRDPDTQTWSVSSGTVQLQAASYYGDPVALRTSVVLRTSITLGAS